MVVFSESFQYIPLNVVLDQVMRYLNPGGYLLICDFFQTDAPGDSPLGGGHKLKEFYQVVGKYPLVSMVDTDITKETAPNLDLILDMNKNVLSPIWNLINDFLTSNHPIIGKLLRWKFKKKIAKMEWKYFSGARNGKNFAIYKSYRLMLFQQKAREK